VGFKILGLETSKNIFRSDRRTLENFGSLIFSSEEVFAGESASWLDFQGVFKVGGGGSDWFL
jgi:hypothetical protein